MRLPISLPPADARTADAVAVGLNSYDILVSLHHHPPADSKQRIQRLEYRAGGQCATAMAACARMGWRARYVGHFGDDDYGKAGVDSLVKEGVDVSYVRTVPGATSHFGIILVSAAEGSRTVLWDRHPALELRPEHVPAAAVENARVLLVDCHETAAATAAARIARARGNPTVLDAETPREGLELLLQQIDIMILSAPLPPQLTGLADTGASLRAVAEEYHPAVACVPLGEHGSLAIVNGREIRTHGYQVPVVDTTGAGDVFRAGFICGWLRHGDNARAEHILEYANAAAALKCRKLGARDGIPTAQEVEDFLRSNPRQSA
jgi:sugar/nucleoside kinase (ribokinase family)